MTSRKRGVTRRGLRARPFALVLILSASKKPPLGIGYYSSI